MSIHFRGGKGLTRCIYFCSQLDWPITKGGGGGRAYKMKWKFTVSISVTSAYKDMSNLLSHVTCTELKVRQ